MILLSERQSRKKVKSGADDKFEHLEKGTIEDLFRKKRFNKSFYDVAFQQFPELRKRWFALSDCCSDVYVREDNHKVVQAFHCKDRLCPICQAMKATRQFMYMYMASEKFLDKYDWYFLTLTVPNFPVDGLIAGYDRMAYGVKKLFASKLFASVKGAYKAFECTFNVDKYSDSYHTFHPHFHVLFALEKGSVPLDPVDVFNQWQKNVGMKLSMKGFDLKPCYGDIRDSLAEITKYTCKVNWDKLSADDGTKLLIEGLLSLKNKRSFDTYGFLKEEFKAVKERHKNDTFAFVMEYISQIIHFAKLKDGDSSADQVDIVAIQAYFVPCHRYRYNGKTGYHLMPIASNSRYLCEICKTDMPSDQIPRLSEDIAKVKELLSSGVVQRYYYKFDDYLADLPDGSSVKVSDLKVPSFVQMKLEDCSA